MRRIYATLEQFAAWAGRVCPQPGAKRLLSRASQDIDAALLTAFYSTDEAGFPTDAAVREVLAEATCALRPLPPGATVLRSPPRCRPAPSFSRSPNSSSGPIGKEKVDELTNPKQVVE